MPRVKSNKTHANGDSSADTEKLKKTVKTVREKILKMPAIDDIELKKSRKKKGAEIPINEEIVKLSTGKRGKKADVVVEESVQNPVKDVVRKGRGVKTTSINIVETDKTTKNGSISVEENPKKNAIKARKNREAVDIMPMQIDKSILSKASSTKIKGKSKANTTKSANADASPNVVEPTGKAKKVSKVSSAKQIAVVEDKVVRRGRKRAKSEEDQGPTIEPSTPKKKLKKIIQKPSVEDVATIIQEETTSNQKSNTKSAKSAVVKPRSRKRAVVVADEANNDDEVAENVIEKSQPVKIIKKSIPIIKTNPTTSKYNKKDFVVTRPIEELDEKEPYNLKISSWNVAGLRSWLKKDGIQFLDYEEPDIFCLQETKCTTDQLPEEARISGYHPYWMCLPGGYAGVAVYSKIMPIHVEYGIGNDEFDDAGRIITAEYEKFYLINVYVPNSGRKLVNLEPRMRWEKLFQTYIKKLDALKPVIICGDMNVSHQEIDLANPKTNTRNAGFTKEERDKMTEFLALGYIDTFRHLYPTRTGAYTFWTYMGSARSRNVGWRLDYFLVSERFIKRVVDNCIRASCLGSDHCPITLYLKL